MGGSRIPGTARVEHPKVKMPATIIDPMIARVGFEVGCLLHSLHMIRVILHGGGANAFFRTHPAVVSVAFPDDVQEMMPGRDIAAIQDDTE